MPGIFELVKHARYAGMAIVVVTNQAGIARGYYTEAQFIDFMDWMLEQFAKRGVPLDAMYYCPHHPTAGLGTYRVVCDCRKPRPGMLMRAAAELGLDLPRSVLVGDKLSDIQAGRAGGLARCVLLTSDHTATSGDGAIVDAVCDDLDAVAVWLLRDALRADFTILEEAEQWGSAQPKPTRRKPYT